MKQFIHFKVKSKYSQKDGRYFQWQAIHENKNIANHKYNSKSGCKAKLKSYLAKIQKGEYVIES